MLISIEVLLRKGRVNLVFVTAIGLHPPDPLKTVLISALKQLHAENNRVSNIYGDLPLSVEINNNHTDYAGRVRKQ